MKTASPTTRQTQRPPLSRRGFTLIELLSVIAIVAILAAVLIPVIGNVRGKAEVSICAANLRTVYGGYRLYASERDDRIIPCDRYRDANDVNNWPNDHKLNWIHAIVKYGYLGMPDRIADQALDIYNKYTRLCFFYTVLGCPTAQNYRLATEGDTDDNGKPIPCTETGWITYVANDPLTNLNRNLNNRMGRYFHQLENPTKTLFMGEKDLGPPRATAYYVMDSGTCKPIAIHDDRCNMLYADGHVELINPKDTKFVPTNTSDRAWKLAWLGSSEGD